MSFGIKLTQKEQIKLDEHLREIEKGRDELSPSEIRYLTYKFKTEVVMPSRKDTSERRSARRASIKESHESQLKWTNNRPPRLAIKR
jgi:hypothetical protein